MANLAEIVNKTATGVKTVGAAHDAILPILKEEDLEYHVNQILDCYKDIRIAVEQKPYLKDVLRRYVKETAEEYKWMLYGAKTIDSIDKLCGVVELGAGIFGPEAETGVKVVTEPLEYVLKVPYSVYYTATTKDYVAPLYFLAAEVASLVPYVGDVVDMMNLYTKRVRSQMQKRVAERFLENIVKSTVPNTFTQKQVFH